MKIKTCLLPILLAILFISCATSEPEPVEEPITVEEDTVTVEQDLPEEPEPAEQVEDVVVNDETGFEVSAELYEQTLDEMRILIEKLNSIISSRSYDKWKNYLSEDYIQTYNDKSKLKEISDQSKILSENKIVLLSLKDYFEWVVVPSRSKAVVDDIVFIDDSHLTVYMLVKEKRTILYELENIEGNWLISVW